MQYRERKTTQWHPLTPGSRPRLVAEKTWEFEGEPAALDSIVDVVGAAADRVTPAHLRLTFGNAVGLFRTTAGITLEVHSGKWEEAHFDAMLADVVSICADLPLATNANAGALPYRRTEQADDPAGYHAFVYLRQILREHAAEPDRLQTALEAVLRDPHRRLETEREVVPLDRGRFVDAVTLQALTRPGALAAVRGRTARLPLAQALSGHLPSTLNQPRTVQNLDTLENRFVRAFLLHSRRIIDEVRGRVAKGEASFLRARLTSDCAWMDALVGGWLQHPIWNDVGDLTQLPLASTVMQARRGYRDVLRHHIRLMLASQALPLSHADTFELLEARNIAVMYELWTYFAVVAELTEILGPPTQAIRTTPAFWGPNVTQGFEVRWPSQHRASYNQTFPGETSSGSYSTELRPDVTLWCPHDECHVLDAKFKVSDGGSFLNADVHKMHAYRDAIGAARSAWVMYPGIAFQEYATQDGGTWGAVGATPLRPEPGGRDELRGLLSRLVGA
ncbi:MAG: DUF2357 domain-containing protein [Myxococcales bacterium]|nr:DUF2357 domain-containing protein [Myxococcales bacterium]